MAFVVPAQGVVMNETSAEEIVNWMAARVAKHKKLRGGIVWIDEIPKSTTGKILRQILKTNVRVTKPMAATKFIYQPVNWKSCKYSQQYIHLHNIEIELYPFR
jgi:hypothetical protein